MKTRKGKKDGKRKGKLNSVNKSFGTNDDDHGAAD